MMPKIALAIASGLLFAGIASNSIAQDTIELEQSELSLPYVKALETGILQNVTGYKGDALGAEIISVTAGEDNLLETIEISIPVDPEEADRVSVISLSGVPLKLKKPIEIFPDHENNKVDIIITLPKKAKLGFKIQLIDLPDE